MGHRIRVAFDYSPHDKDTRCAYMAGGFCIFAPHNGLTEDKSELPLKRAEELGADIIEELKFHTHIWKSGRGNQDKMNLWKINARSIGNVTFEA